MAQLAIIIPAYNERHRIGPTLQAIREHAGQHHLDWQVIVVDDGSTDGTAEIVEAFEWGPIETTVLINERNRGKGYSVRRGMLEANGEMRLMFDADSSTPIEEIDKLLPFVERGYGVVIGSRSMPDTQLNPPQGPFRRLLGACFRIFRKALLLRGLNDTQCGFKLFTAEAARDVFSQQTDTGFAFDVEVLALAERLGHRIREVGIVWHDSKPSRVNTFTDSFKMFFATWRIWWRLRKIKPADQTPSV